MSGVGSAGAGSGVDGPVRERLEEMIEAGLTVWTIGDLSRYLADEIDRLRGEMNDLRAMDNTLLKLFPRPPATAAGESGTGSGTTPTCGSTGDVKNDEPTPEMIEAGADAFVNNEFYDMYMKQADPCVRLIVTEIYRAMRAAR